MLHVAGCMHGETKPSHPKLGCAASLVAGGHGGSKQKRTSMCPLLVGASCGCLGVPFFLAKHPRNVPMTAHLQAHDPDALSGVWGLTAVRRRASGRLTRQRTAAAPALRFVFWQAKLLYDSRR